MRTTHLLLALALAGLLACGGGAEEADETPADTVAQREGIVVPDSTIQREVQTRLEADPRLDKEGVEIEVHATDGDVTLVGTVPTRMEMSHARDVALSAPGVDQVFLDSLRVLSEPEEEGEPKAAT